MKKKTLLTALILGAMTVPSVFAYDDIDGVNYNIKDPNIGTYVERQPDGTTTSKLVLRKELMGVEGVRLVADHTPGSSLYDSGYIGGSSVIMKTVDTSTPDTMEYARMESGAVDLVRRENGQDVYTTRVSYGGFTNTNRENKKIDIMHGTINISDYSTDAHDHDITLGLEHGLYQGDMTERNGSRLTKDKLTISKINGEEEYDDYGNDITKKFTADYDLNGMTVANEHGNIKFTTSGINAGNQKIEGVATGVADTDAVNVKQLNDKIGALKDNDTITNVTAGPNITVVKSATPGQNGMPAEPTFNVSLTPDVAINSANFSGSSTNIETDITATGVTVKDPNGSGSSMNNRGFNVFEGNTYSAMQNDHIHFGDTSKNESADYSLKGIYLADNDSDPINITKENISFGGRQLHDVAAGKADTDVVNVKQLKDSIAAATSNIVDNDTITTVTAGDNAVVTSTGHDYKVAVSKTLTDMTSATFGSGDTRNVIDKGSIRVFDGSVNTGVTSNGMTIENTDTLEQASYTGSGMQASDDNATVRFTTTNIDAGNQIVHGVKAGVADTDAVNVKQLKDFMSSNDKDTITTVKAGNRIKVTNTGHDYTVALDDKTIDQINTTETGMKGNARDIAKLKVDVVEAKTSVSVGDGLHVKPSYNTNGSTNYHVTIDSKVTDQIKDNTDAIKANSTKIADNKARIDDLANKIDTNNSNYNRVISNNQKEARHGIAGASALAAMHPLDYDPEHKVDVMAGVGHFKGSTAVAIGAAYRPNENLMFTVGTSLNGSDSTINAGVTYKVGTDAKDTYHSKANMMNKIKQLETTVEEQNAQIEKLMKIVDALVPANTQA